MTGRATQRHRLGLLALLGGSAPLGLTRDKLATYLWPDADEERARALLSDSIYRINQALGGAGIIAQGDMVRLDPVVVRCDVTEFRAAVAAADWSRAVELHSAPFLDGFYLSDAEAFEHWSEAERQRLSQEKLDVLEQLARTAPTPREAARWWQQLAELSPFSSRVALELMQALENAGERAAAIQHAQVHARRMQEQLSLDADPAIEAYAAQLRQAGRRAAIVPAPSTAPEPDAAAEESMTAPILPVRRASRWAVVAAAFVLAGAVVVGLATLVRRQAAADADDATTSIAVLPFADLSPARDHEYFGDGVADELMVRLAAEPRFRVAGRTSSFAFKNKPVDAREIAARLNVDAVLSGSVRVAERQLRITAQLVDARTGFEIWSETYERAPADVLDIQTDIANAIVTRLGGSVDSAAAAAPAARPVIDDPEAYNLYLRGRFEWHKRTEAGLRNAVTYLTRATTRAPQYARAQAGLGDAYAVLGFYDYLPPRIAFPNAKRAALRALRLDPNLAEAHNTLGYVALYYEWDWAEAERAFQRSIQLEPRYSTAHQWYGNLLTAMGRFDEAVREMRLAQELDPLSLIANAALGWTWYFAGENERAVAQFDRTLDLDVNFELAHLWRGLALQELRRWPEAGQAFERAVELSRGGALSSAYLAQWHARSGDSTRARALLAELLPRDADAYAPSYEIAKVYLALGERATALTWLERALEERSHSIAFLRVDPQLRALRGDAAFQRLLERAGLAGQARARG